MSILQVKEVSKSFGGLRALNNVNLEVEEGTVHAIIGPNGAGKSTLLNCFVGKLEPDTGLGHVQRRLALGDQALRDQPGGRRPRLPDTGDLRAISCLLENVMIPMPLETHDGAFSLNFLAARFRPHQGALEDEAEQDAGAIVGILGQRIDTLASALSRGDKRRLEMAMCLIQKPKLLLLDEPTAGMSRADTNNTIDLLKRVGEGITKVVIEHDMHVVFSLAEKISVLAQGTVIAEGAPDEIKGDPRVQEAYLGGAHL